MLSLPLFLLVPAYLATASPIVPQGQAPEPRNVNAAVVPLTHPVYHRFSTRAGERKIFNVAAAKKEKEDIQRKHGKHSRKRAVAEKQKEKEANNDAAAQRGKNDIKNDAAQKAKDGKKTNDSQKGKNDAQKGKNDATKKGKDDATKKGKDDATKKGKDDATKKGKDGATKNGKNGYHNNANQKGKADNKNDSAHGQKEKEGTKNRPTQKGKEGVKNDAIQKAKDDTKDNNMQKAKDDAKADAQKGKADSQKEKADAQKGKANDQKGKADSQKEKADAQKGKANDQKANDQKAKNDATNNAQKGKANDQKANDQKANDQKAKDDAMNNAQKGKNDSQKGKGKDDVMSDARKGQNDMKSDAQKGKTGNNMEGQKGKDDQKHGATWQKGKGNEQGPHGNTKWPLSLGTPGTHHPDELFDVGDLRRRGQLEKRQGSTGNAPLTNHQGKDFAYYGPVSLGTPGQESTVLFDTGSSDLIIPLSTCTTCTDGPFFHANQSSSFSDTHRFFEIQYLDGSASRGTIASDVVTVAGLSVANQSFGAIQTESNDQGLPSAGIMGMGFPSNAETRATPFFWNLVHNSALASNLFSFYLSRDVETGSELCFGCVDSTKYTGEISWYPLDTTVTNGTNYWWNIVGDGISVGGSQPSGRVEAIIDSGTTLIYVPPLVAEELYRTIPGSTEDILDLGQGYYTFPCDNHVLLPPISFVFGGVAYEVNKEDFNIGAIDIFGDRCVGGIVGMDIGLPVPAAILGVEFMKGWYSVFDLNGLRVGFAPAVGPPTTVGI